jgi:light-regulated signal transduction histidine kinase (bacteriophytochrome)
VPLRREPVHLSQLAGFVVEDLRRNQPQRTVEVQIQPDLVAHGDPILLRQLVENLIGNAWKYSQRASPARISFGASMRDGETVYVVTDNGAGFDMRAAGKLFGLFQRLHGQSDFPGTGLGLASVQRIVLRHGGRVWAEAEPGRGARFYFTLQGSPGPRPPG